MFAGGVASLRGSVTSWYFGGTFQRRKVWPQCELYVIHRLKTPIKWKYWGLINIICSNHTQIYARKRSSYLLSKLCLQVKISNKVVFGMFVPIRNNRTWSSKASIYMDIWVISNQSSYMDPLKSILISEQRKRIYGFV